LNILLPRDVPLCMHEGETEASSCDSLSYVWR